MPCTIRDAAPDDDERLIALFRASVREAARRDYSEAQVRAWAPGGTNPRTKEPTPDRYGVTKVTTRYRTSVLASMVKEDEDSIRAALLGE